MKAFTFKHGIHPKDEKHQTEDKAIQLLEPKGELVYPMLQHIGAPCAPTVAKGDQVFMGQKIGEPQGFISSPILTSVSGKVKEIKEVLHPSGMMMNAVVVENDGLYTLDPSLKANPDFSALSKEEILQIVKNSGIVGLGGAGFPTHVKLAPPADKTIDFIIVNAAECEPFLTSDYRIMLEETDRIIKGLEIILSLFPKAAGKIGIETNKPKAIEALIKAASGHARIEVVPVKTKYPQGAEKQLIFATTGRTVPSGKLPSDAGCIVQNTDTVVAICRAVCEGLPLMRRIVTVSGGAVKNPGNFEVKIGSSYREVIEAAGGFIEEPKKVISGGPMMGIALFSIDVPIIKTSSSILCLTEKETGMDQENNCIRCGRCVDHCPMRLLPLELNKYALAEQPDIFKKYRGMDCIECGACSFICPSKRHLLQSIRTAKKNILKNTKKA